MLSNLDSNSFSVPSSFAFNFWQFWVAEAATLFLFAFTYSLLIFL